MEFSRVSTLGIRNNIAEIRSEPNGRALAACVVAIILSVSRLPFGSVQYYS